MPAEGLKDEMSLFFLGWNDTLTSCASEKLNIHMYI